MVQLTDDILLVKQLQQGDENAFRNIFDLYFVPLCRYANLYVPYPQEAEDIVMDLFIYIWESREHLTVQLSIKAYLFQSVRNRMLNHLRNKPERLSIEQLPSEPAELFETTLEMDELYNLVVDAVSSLPEKCREVFLLSREQQLTNKEIAEELGVTVKTVEAQITKALRNIKKQLGSAYYFLF